MPPEDDQKTPEQIAADEETTRMAEEDKHLNDAGKAALKAERDARKIAAKEAADAKARLAELEAKQAAADAEKAKADEEAAARRGEFEQIAIKRAEELTAASGERDAYKAQLDTLIAAIKPDIDAQWSALPAEVTELYEGDGDDVLAKRTHITRHKKLIDRLTEKQDSVKAAAGFGRTPQPNGKKQDEFKPVAQVRF